MPAFRLEETLRLDNDRVVVFAHRLDEEDFELGPAPTLGGIPIRQWLTVPRKLLPDGSLDCAFFAFCLVNPRDEDRLPLGENVELCP